MTISEWYIAEKHLIWNSWIQNEEHATFISFSCWLSKYDALYGKNKNTSRWNKIVDFYKSENNFVKCLRVFQFQDLQSQIFRIFSAAPSLIWIKCLKFVIMIVFHFRMISYSFQDILFKRFAHFHAIFSFLFLQIEIWGWVWTWTFWKLLKINVGFMEWWIPRDQERGTTVRVICKR